MVLSLWLAAGARAQPRLVVIDQDAYGPGGTNQMSIMALLQSPQVRVLGIAVVTGDGWRDEEVQHTLRMLELIGRPDVPVVPGAVFPLVRTQQETALAEKLAGGVGWLGAWGRIPEAIQKGGSTGAHGAWEVPPLEEGPPHTQPLAEDAAHFLIRQVRAHPHQVTVYAAGPLTDLALAIRLDPQFAELAQGLVMMGGSLNPQSDDPEFAYSPRHEFNFWFDPEAARIVLRAHWPRIDLTTVDVSIKARLTRQMLDEISQSHYPAARYVARYSRDVSYMWDELAACSLLDPSIITGAREVYMDVDVSHGPSYGETLTWSKELKPGTDLQLVHAQVDVDVPRFTRMFVALMSGPTPGAAPQ
ncbi:MAG: nucleoside hydrolase [Acidobacteria bacterium]|nr:nucleoside hydrolase [Acidobacteriota bacterium]